MQTFLPYRNFTQTARVLDYRRLGKQRVEAMQILKALLGESPGWRTHPATRMWSGWENSLASYGLAMCNEWRRRGYKDTLTDYFLDRFDVTEDSVAPVPYFITEEFTLSHQSNLLRKYPEYYRPIFGPDVPDDLPYAWPVSHRPVVIYL